MSATHTDTAIHHPPPQAPRIIFIDEIDAIGRSRSTLGADPGSMERESALLAMLVAMDGIHGNLEQARGGGPRGLCEVLGPRQLIVSREVAAMCCATLGKTRLPTTPCCWLT